MNSLAKPDVPVQVCAVVVTYNSAAGFDDFLASVRAEADATSIRLVVVDNASTDGTANLAATYDDVVVVESGGNLGYAGGLNAARQHIGECEAVLVLNPDLTLLSGAVAALFQALSIPEVGVAIPLMLDSGMEVYPSLRNEPSIVSAMGDAAAGDRMRRRPTSTSTTVFDSAAYRHGHLVDWATGAALMVRRDVWDEVGEWDDRFFLYSEEVDYCRRVRELGHGVWFEPSASVSHVGAGSGVSPVLHALMAVNSVRYIEKYHGPLYSGVYRIAALTRELVRAYDAEHRSTLAILARRRTWSNLPSAPYISAASPPKPDLGSVIIPAYDEGRVIEKTLRSLSALAVDGVLDVIVVCNGCSDDTADRARRIPAVRVHEIADASKVKALNAGDDLALLWPRVYLDADIGEAAAGVLGTLVALRGETLAARPAFVYDTRNSSAAVRSYYRARRRVGWFDAALWGAGCYGMSEAGHERLGSFPDVVADDVAVDMLFDSCEKRIVDTEPVVVAAPRNSESLLGILTRNHRGVRQVDGGASGKTVAALVRSIRGPFSAFDAVVYSGFALVARYRAGLRTVTSATWERDLSTR